MARDSDASLERATKTVLETASQPSEPIAHVSIAPQPDIQRPPDELKPQEYPGLIYFHLTAGNEGRKLIAYWRDQASLNAYGSLLENTLSCAPREFEGPVVDLRLPPKKRFGWPTLRSAVIGAAALFGAFSAIQDYYARLLQPADVEVRFADASPLNSLEKESFSVGYTLINEDRFGAAKVWDDGAIARSNGKLFEIRHAEPPNVITARLDPGATINASIVGNAPALETRNSPPADYDLTVRIQAQEGWVWRRSQFNSTPRKLKIWPELGWDTPALDPPGAELCIFSGRIYPGKGYPNGARGQISLDGPIEITPDVSVVQSQEKYPTQPANRVSVIFVTRPLFAFTEAHYRLTLTATRPATKEQWVEVAKSIRVAFEGLP